MQKHQQAFPVAEIATSGEQDEHCKIISHKPKGTFLTGSSRIG